LIASSPPSAYMLTWRLGCPPDGEARKTAQRTGIRGSGLRTTEPRPLGLTDGGAQCPCGDEAFEVGVAFSLREDGDVRWITVGGLCVACGVLGAYADWKIDYSPTDHLLTAA
jgi:hypothetical protein